MAWCAIGAGTPENYRALRTLPYRVPDDVHTPLIEAGLIDDPLKDANSLTCRWVEEQEFWCERCFTLREDDLAPTMRLTFEGLDTTADIYLNGAYIGRHNNAFVEITWDVKDRLRVGENTLLVRIDQGLAEAQTHDLAQMGKMWNNEQPWRVWMRKPQFVYGWDWTIWLPSCGIWRSVYLNAYTDARISDVYARVDSDTVREGEACPIAVSIETERFSERAVSLLCHVRDAEGRIVAQANAVPEDAQTLSLCIPDAHLWWCNGMGEPYLYRVEVSLCDAQGAVLASRTQSLGLRIVALIEPPLADGETGFTFILNGEPIFCKGANHVPCDCLPGRITPEKERALIALTKDAGMNMLRIWGGGVYASDALMDACDASGILVWHDFMYACGYYPDHDSAFVAEITLEARKSIRRLRPHASLIGWAGNNEIQEMYRAQKQWDADLPWYGGSIYEKILPALVQDLCPTLVYQPSSPFGGTHQADCRHGDQHIWLLTHVDSHLNYLDLWHFTDFKVKFFSEFGVMGAMCLETAQDAISPAHLHPSDPVWLHHTNTSQAHTLLSRIVEQYFGDDACSLQEFILRSQALQAEITRHIYEEFRRQKFTCSGLLFWTLSDSYAVNNWSLIDYPLRRKPIYHALKRAMAPYALCVRGWDVQTNEGRATWRTHWQNTTDVLEIWGMNDTRFAREAHLSWTLMRRNGDILLDGSRAVRLEANASAMLCEIALAGVPFDPADAVLRARLSDGDTLLNETKYFFAPFAEMPAHGAHIHYTCHPLDVSHYSITLTSDHFIWLLHLPEPADTTYSDNDFDLWPNEPKTITVHSSTKDFSPTMHWMGKI